MDRARRCARWSSFCYHFLRLSPVTSELCLFDFAGYITIGAFSLHAMVRNGRRWWWILFDGSDFGGMVGCHGCFHFGVSFPLVTAFFSVFQMHWAISDMTRYPGVQVFFHSWLHSEHGAWDMGYIWYIVTAINSGLSSLWSYHDSHRRRITGWGDNWYLV